MRKHGEKDLLIVYFYIDDMIYMGSFSYLINEFKACKKNKFLMTNLGKLHYFLRLEVKQVEDGIFASQKKYATNLF